jgi:hypothetical protein
LEKVGQRRNGGDGLSTRIIPVCCNDFTVCRAVLAVRCEGAAQQQDKAGGKMASHYRESVQKIDEVVQKKTNRYVVPFSNVSALSPPPPRLQPTVDGGGHYPLLFYRLVDFTKSNSVINKELQNASLSTV